jgi:hypothetical protein
MEIQPNDPYTEPIILGVEMANAAPEWQAGSLWVRSFESVAACPLEGLVGWAI